MYRNRNSPYSSEGGSIWCYPWCYTWQWRTISSTCYPHLQRYRERLCSPSICYHIQPLIVLFAILYCVYDTLFNVHLDFILWHPLLMQQRQQFYENSICLSNECYFGIFFLCVKSWHFWTSSLVNKLSSTTAPKCTGHKTRATNLIIKQG